MCVGTLAPFVFYAFLLTLSSYRGRRLHCELLCCAILSCLLTLLFAGGWPVSCYVVRLAGGVVALPWHLLRAAAEKNQVPPTTSRSSHTRWWSRLQRCPLAQPNHAGNEKGLRQVSQSVDNCTNMCYRLRQWQASQSRGLSSNRTMFSRSAPLVELLLWQVTWQTLQASSCRSSGRSL